MILKKISSVYKDHESLSLIYLRLGSVYESSGNFYNASDSYINVIKTESGIWQNSIASKRLIYLTTEKKVILDSSEKFKCFASALYDAGQFNKALIIIETILQKEQSTDMEILKLNILTLKNYPKAILFLKSKEGSTGYEKLLLAHANILWEHGRRKESVKIYNRLTSTSDNQLLEGVLTRLSFYYEERNKPEFISYMELYMKKFPEEVQSGRFLWLIGRYFVKINNREKASEYFKTGIMKYPDNFYTSYCRFWLYKNSSTEKKTRPPENLEFLEELAVNNPDTYHALTLLKDEADKSETSILTKQYKEALKNKNKNRALLFHTLLFIKNGYNNSHSERLKQLDNSITTKYTETAGLFKKNIFF